MNKREYAQVNKNWLTNKAQEDGVKPLPKGIYYFYCPVKLYDKLRFFYRTANILLEDTMA